ncbi:hypothetical protein [Pseudonocardia sp.]|uniref:hypothetical protein n=1 Tax=Pseudonocardia sp. TaxID=60912 RepID=UPI003D0E515F
MPITVATPVPTPEVPDRYADAVRARRAELRAARDRLAGVHRDLRSALTIARLGASAEFADATGRLAAEARAFLKAAERRERARFPAVLLDAAERLRAWAAPRRAGTVRAAARRVATRRGIPVGAAWPVLADDPPRPLPAPATEPGGSPWSSIAGGWRAALLPAATLPLTGLSVASPGAVVATSALGLGAAVLVGGHQSATAERARLRRWSDEVLLAVRADGDAALARMVLRIEQAAGELDAAIAAARAGIDAELAELAPGAGR